MATLPQLIEEDVRELDRALRDLLGRSEATTAVIIDKGGFVITKYGQTEQFDVTTLAALAAASFAATETIAGLVAEKNFSSIYQQGDNYSMLVINVDEYCLLTVLFKATISVGAVKYFAGDTVRHVGAQMKVAEVRAPGRGFDLSELNMTDASPLFLRKAAG